jgi:hypothetical protein
VQRIARRATDATRCENGTGGAALRFSGRSAKEGERFRAAAPPGETERERTGLGAERDGAVPPEGERGGEKRSERKSFPLVERNARRSTPRSSDSGALAAHYAIVPLLLLNRALDRCGRTIKTASPRLVRVTRARNVSRFSLPIACDPGNPASVVPRSGIESEALPLATLVGIPICNSPNIRFLIFLNGRHAP